MYQYPADTDVPSFRSRVVCAKCGSRGNKIDVRPKWKEQLPQQSLVGKVWRSRGVPPIVRSRSDGDPARQGEERSRSERK